MLCRDVQINKVSTRKEITLDNPNAVYSALFSMAHFTTMPFGLLWDWEIVLIAKQVSDINLFQGTTHPVPSAVDNLLPVFLPDYRWRRICGNLTRKHGGGSLVHVARLGTTNKLRGKTIVIILLFYNNIKTLTIATFTARNEVAAR